MKHVILLSLFLVSSILAWSRESFDNNTIHTKRMEQQNPTYLWAIDNDGDGYGNPAVTIISETQPEGYVQDGSDCNDNDASIHPDTVWYLDADTDGFGNPDISLTQCESPAGYVRNDLDCDDTNAQLNPNTVWYYDEDGDGFGDPNFTTVGCLQAIDFVDNGNDQCPQDFGTHNGCPVPPIIPNNENYIHTQVLQVPSTAIEGVNTAEIIADITYFDGLGKAKQQVDIGASPTRQDIVTHIAYDAYGRQHKEYLPFQREGVPAGHYSHVDVVADINTYYKATYPEDFSEVSQEEVNAYTETIFEASPLNHVVRKGAPGQSWKVSNEDTQEDHSIKLERSVNQTDEIARFDIVFANDDSEQPTLVRTGFYEAEEVFVTTTKDENWRSDQTYPDDHTTREYTDKQGRVLLKRVYNDNVPHDTYYVYDIYSNLSYVLPPKVSFDATGAVPAEQLSTLCYQYVYDAKNRLVEKKIPGKDWEHIIYDPLDRVVLTQDGKQRNLNAKEWIFTKYDVLGRVAYTGMVTSNYDRETIQAYYDNNPALFTLYETKTTTAQTIAGTTLYYKSEARPLQVDEIYTINYYDTYDFDIAGATNPGTAYGKEVTTHTKTLPTGTKVRVLGTDKWITTVNYYDEKARLLYAYTYNEYLGTTNTVSNKLDFTGRIHESTTTHQRNADAVITTIDQFTYDHVGRLLTHTQTINNQKEELIACNTYDELGMLVKKAVGGTAAALSEQQYTDIVNVIVSDTGEISKNSTDNSWSAGIATVKSIIGDGAVSFIPQQTNKAVMVGLSYSNANTTLYNAIDFAIYAKSNGTIGVYEKGKNLGEYGSYTTTDTLSVQREGTQIRYQKNGVTVYTSTVASTGTMIGDVSLYHSDTAIKDLDVTGDLKKGLQTLDYVYNVRGWLKQINNPHETLGDDLFAFGINYDATTNSTQALYNGNISQTFSKTANDGIKRRYDYAYDALNRITTGVHISGKYNLTDVKYDKNGNILNLTRTGWQNGVSYANMDRLTYHYDAGNQLAKVIDTGNDQYGFIDGTNTSDDYVYDVNGNMTVDRNKGITNIRYNNHLNLPTQVAINGKQINYVYDATGVKQSKSFDGTFTLYDKGYIYENGELQFFNHPEGYVQPNTDGNFEYIYQYKDHLGNIRLSYSDTNKDDIVDESEIREENNYYPFGLQHKGYNDTITGREHPYGYNGKEEQNELGLDWLDFGFRNYDASIGKWFNVDPMADKMKSNSPYNYAFNSPLYYIDPDGQIPYPITIRCFAPFESFGGGFHGDNRGFSTSNSASARVHQKINFDTDKTTIKTNTWSSPTWHNLNSGFKRTATPSVEFTKDFTINRNGDSKTFGFGTHYSGANPLTPGAPNIDVFSEFSITEDKKAGTLDISGKLTGDNFPSTEAFITDPAGNNVFIGIGFYEGSPFSSLWGENEDNEITDFSFSITTDSDGNFTGVKVGDTNYTLSEWNKLFEDADPHKNSDK